MNTHPKPSIKLIFLVLIAFIFTACSDKKIEQAAMSDPAELKQFETKNPLPDSLTSGSSYLSVYSQIYIIENKRKQDLAVTVSLRNLSRKDSIYFTAIEHFDTSGKLVASYVQKPIVLQPLQTVEIVLSQYESVGETGGNFIFDWHKPAVAPNPLFEAVMISTMGQQGLSFVTTGTTLK